MKTVDCPHCYTRVIARPDGQCPACQQNVNDDRGVDPTRAALTILMIDALPGLCYHCGRPTNRSAYVRGTRSDGSHAPSRGLAWLLTAASFIFLPFFVIWFRTSRTQEVSLHLPQCKACAATQGKPQPRYVNFSRDSMTFIVDQRFQREVLRLRQQPASL